MDAVAALLIAGSAAIAVILGLLHLLYTFRGRMLMPREAELHARMQQVSPVITRETTMWKAWIGFNASHACGLVLFGAVYGYLAIAHAELLFHSDFLLALGLVALLAYAFLAGSYFFRVPLQAILVATLLYGLGLVLGWT